MAGRATWNPARPGAAVGVCESVYSEALAEEIVARVAAGESLTRVCETPGMPDRHTVSNWGAARADFSRRLKAAMREACRRQRLEDRARRALVKPGRGRPSSYTRAKGAAICARLANGETLTAIGRDPAMPCFGTVLKWVKDYPEFEQMYVEARQMQAEYLFDKARDVGAEATPGTVWVSRLQFDIIRWQTARLAPKKYCEPLVVMDAAAQARTAEAQAEAEARAAARAPTSVVFSVTHFEKGPNGTVLAAPPRCAEEAQAWVAATGRPYAPGIGPQGQVRPPLGESLEGLPTRAALRGLVASGR